MAIIPLRIFGNRPNFNIVPSRKFAYVFSASAIIGAMVALFMLGLNLGIDFRGGSLIEVRYPTQPNITELRGKVDALNLGEVTIQEFGEPTDVLVRVQRQGDAVEPGQVIAVAGNTGTMTTGPHLHFELWSDGYALNPEEFIDFE